MQLELPSEGGMLSGVSTEEDTEVPPLLSAVTKQSRYQGAVLDGSQRREEANQLGQIPGRHFRWFPEVGNSLRSCRGVKLSRQHRAQKGFHPPACPAADSHDGTRCHAAAPSRGPCSSGSHWLGCIRVFLPTYCPMGSGEG